MSELNSVLNYIPNQLRNIITEISKTEEYRSKKSNRRNKIKSQ